MITLTALTVLGRENELKIHTFGSRVAPWFIVSLRCRGRTDRRLPSGRGSFSNSCARV